MVFNVNIKYRCMPKRFRATSVSSSAVILLLERQPLQLSDTFILDIFAIFIITIMGCGESKEKNKVAPNSALHRGKGQEDDITQKIYYNNNAIYSGTTSESSYSEEKGKNDLNHTDFEFQQKAKIFNFVNSMAHLRF